jgi:hypothetical protein
VKERVRVLHHDLYDGWLPLSPHVRLPYCMHLSNNNKTLFKCILFFGIIFIIFTSILLFALYPMSLPLPPISLAHTQRLNLIYPLSFLVRLLCIPYSHVSLPYPATHQLQSATTLSSVLPASLPFTFCMHPCSGADHNGHVPPLYAVELVLLLHPRANTHTRIHTHTHTALICLYICRCCNC